MCAGGVFSGLCMLWFALECVLCGAYLGRRALEDVPWGACFGGELALGCTLGFSWEVCLGEHALGLGGLLRGACFGERALRGIL